jgi:hypothetical protein
VRNALVVVALAGCSSAPKQDVGFPAQCITCDGGCDGGGGDDAGVLVDDGMLAARKDEYGPMFDTHITWTGKTAEPHIRIGGGFESGAGLTRDHRVRVLLDTVGAIGALGDTKHGLFFLGADMRLKVSLLPDMTLFDPYAVASVGGLGGFINVPKGVAPIGVAGGGAGLGLFRSVAVELTFNAAHAFDAPFVSNSGSRQDWVFDFNIGARFDLCSLGTWCDLDPIKQTRTDLTCALYEQATRVCDAAQATNGRDALCTKALSAMTTSDRVEPTLAREAVNEFIKTLDSRELQKKNDCLVGWRTCGRTYECSLAQKGQKPADHRIYSPYVLELMAALGCDATGRPAHDADGNVNACGYACEDAIQEKDRGVCR